MQIPASPGELTADWLTSVLRVKGGTNSVQSCDVELLGGEQGITGQLARLRIHYQDDERGWPQTLIAKFSAAEPARRAVITALGLYEREVRFYELLSSRTPVPTPRCYYSHFDPQGGFALLVLEDLAEARNGNSIAGCSVGEVARVLSTLARVHATWWQAGLLSSPRLVWRALSVCPRDSGLIPVHSGTHYCLAIPTDPARRLIRPAGGARALVPSRTC